MLNHFSEAVGQTEVFHSVPKDDAHGQRTKQGRNTSQLKEMADTKRRHPENRDPQDCAGRHDEWLLHDEEQNSTTSRDDHERAQEVSMRLEKIATDDGGFGGDISDLVVAHTQQK